MVNLTLSLSEELKRNMEQHLDIKWSEVARKAIENKLKEIQIEERILSKSKLTMKDVEEISNKIKKEIGEEIRRNWRLS
jgi:cell division GTPase FtsZ